MSITLKNAANADVVYNLARKAGNTAYFVSAGASLLEKSRLTLQIVEKTDTNRVVGKLSVPSILECPDQCVTPKVAYTEIGSFDLTAVLASKPADLENFFAQFKSLISSAAVRAMYEDGILPS